MLVVNTQVLHMGRIHRFFLWYSRWQTPVEIWWYTVTHGSRSEGETGEWSGFASTLHTTSEHGVSSITTADAAHLGWPAVN